jgi:hypothetical protein
MPWCHILIENSLLVEIKSVGKLLPIHSSQLMTYMRLQRVSSGLLINFKRDYSGPWHQESPVLAIPPCYLRVLRDSVVSICTAIRERIGRER